MSYTSIDPSVVELMENKILQMYIECINAGKEDYRVCTSC